MMYDQGMVDSALRPAIEFSVHARNILGDQVDEGTFRRLVQAAEDFADQRTDHVAATGRIAYMTIRHARQADRHRRR